MAALLVMQSPLAEDSNESNGRRYKSILAEATILRVVSALRRLEVSNWKPPHIEREVQEGVSGIHTQSDSFNSCKTLEPEVEAQLSGKRLNEREAGLQGHV